MRVGGKSLLERTVARAAKVPGVSHYAVVTNANYAHQVTDELKNVQGVSVSLLLEPQPRNTAPAISVAALWVAENFGGDELMLVLPADHLIAREDEFALAAVAAGEVARATGQLVLFGVTPSHAETGFGYIEWGEPIGDTRAHRVKRFIEKPSIDAAARMVDTGNFAWNSGMFCFTAATLIEGLRRCAPKILTIAERVTGKAVRSDRGLTFDEITFAEFEDISIDYALMERANNAAVIPCDLGWSDVGSWKAVSETHTPDGSGNVIDGRALLVNSSGTYVNSEQRLVAAVGVEDMMIVDTPDALLVCHKSASQYVRDVVKSLQRSGDTEHKLHTTVQRPWGSYTTLFETAGFKVKRITVKPCQALSLQYHCHRAEHWVLVKGEALIEVSGTQQPAKPGEAHFIPMGATHRLTNIGECDVEFVEVQLGDYLGEDDIVRLADNYGRVS
jgi:mannose-1-phosphate guanylyltransferase / mannose-6-phosphate isomerase